MSLCRTSITGLLSGALLILGHFLDYFIQTLGSVSKIIFLPALHLGFNATVLLRAGGSLWSHLKWNPLIIWHTHWVSLHKKALRNFPFWTVWRQMRSPLSVAEQEWGLNGPTLDVRASKMGSREKRQLLVCRCISCSRWWLMKWRWWNCYLLPCLTSVLPTVFQLCCCSCMYCWKIQW